MAMNNLAVVPLPNGAMDWPRYVDAKSLGVATNEEVTVPTGAVYVVFSSTGDFYVRWGASDAAVPGDTADGTACELNPTTRRIPGLTAFNLISPAACVVTMAFFKD